MLGLQKAVLRAITSILVQSSGRLPDLQEAKDFHSLRINSLIVHAKRNFQELMTRGKVHQHNIRRRYFIDIIMYRLTETERHFPVLAYKFFNHLPTDNLKILNDRSFTTIVGEWLLQNLHYSLEKIFEDTVGDTFLLPISSP